MLNLLDLRRFIKIFALFFQLEQKHGEGQDNQSEENHSEVGVAVDRAIILRESHETPAGTRDNENRVDKVTEQEKKEEFVVASAQAVIDEGTVVVVVVRAPVANCAVEWVFSFDYFVKNA